MANRFYLDPDLADYFSVNYYDAARLVVALSTLRRVREWDMYHQQLWNTHASPDVVGVRTASDAPGWFRLISR